MVVGRLYTQYSRSEIYGFEMMKIENKTGKRILIGGRDLPLHTYCNNDNVWFWYIYTKEKVDSRLFSKSGEDFELFLKMGQKYPYPAYEGRMYCIYLGTSMKLRIYGMDYSYYTPTNVRREGTLS